MTYDEFIDAVAELGQLSREEAEEVTHATLQTLAERITGGEADDVASQLPKRLKDALLTTNEQAEPCGLEEFKRRVSERSAGIDDTTHAIRAVMTTLREALTGGEFDDVMDQLPVEFGAVIAPVGASHGRSG
jgi:uncharacterized protein (DUF2267 family)